MKTRVSLEYFVTDCSPTIIISCAARMGRNDMVLNIFAYPTVTVVYFTDQNWISKTVNCIRSVKYFIAPNSQRGWRKPANWMCFALLHASMVVTYYIKLFRAGTDRRNDILVVETNMFVWEKKQYQINLAKTCYMSKPFCHSKI